ncbi:MAG TPA: hypothetical protein VKP58_13500, partial [Candidatus Acidoferrum sp.]|nr:hypothetical protein [Candidatus Acidoferrum sp.]
VHVGLCCAAIAMLAGCAERKVRAFPWATAVVVRPNPPIVHGDPSSAAEIAPDFRIEAPASNGRLFATRPAPPRPHANTPQQPEAIGAAKSQMLVPELSPQETAAAKAQFAESVAIVEQNLATAQRRKLTSAQSDVVSKINGFVAEAREASGEGDWARARNLAKKAQILSQDLASSL